MFNLYREFWNEPLKDNERSVNIYKGELSENGEWGYTMCVCECPLQTRCLCESLAAVRFIAFANVRSRWSVNDSWDNSV